MKRLALLVLPVALGCQDESSQLGPGTPADAGRPPDAGAGQDAAVLTDAGDPTDAGPGPFCAAAADFRIGVSGISDPVWEGRVAEVDGPARLTFVTDQGQGQIVLFGGEVPVSYLADGQYLVRVELYQPFWVEARVTFWRIGPTGGRGAIAFIGFDGGEFRTGRASGLPGHAYDFESQGCLLLDQSCGDATALVLRTVVHGDQIVLPIGDKAVGPTYEVFNGESHVYEEGAGCEDVPDSRAAGWIAFAATRDGECIGLPRDECVDSPRCVLWGSENSDPGYVCQPARGACELFTQPTDCQVTPGCEWFPGDCYCPEDEVCACGGGPAPMCMNTCSARPDGVCPEQRHCGSPARLEDSCQPAPGAAGRCEWRAPSCEGASNDPICACGDNGPQTYDNDCARRAAGAGVGTQGACPP